ncbi:MAG: hypothetical protein DME52_09470 [Verrucomicrobia bacterium]|nr:MAG: hypothetical protein DME52_09470 [Verrucomicrobiota bacterium]
MIWVPGFVSRDQPQAESDINTHENDERCAYPERHFAALLSYIRPGWQHKFARVPAHSGLNLPSDCQLALQLLV